MNLYVIHDGPTGNPDDTTTMAVWADTPEQAIEVYWRHHRFTPHRKEDRDEKVRLVDNPECNPEGQEPHVDDRGELLRPLGFGEDGEEACLSCGLYACGLE